VRQVPQLHHCPDCHYQLEAGDGPHGLAWHGCGLWPAQARVSEEEDEEQQDDAISLALRAASDPKLTAEGAAIAYSRVLLHQMATQREVVGSPGDFFAGLGKFAQAAPSDAGGLAGLLELLKGKDDA